MMNIKKIRKNRDIDISRAKQDQIDKFDRRTETSWFKDKTGSLVRGTSATSVGSHGVAKNRSLSGNGKRLLIGRKSIGNSFNEKLDVYKIAGLYT